MSAVQNESGWNDAHVAILYRRLEEVASADKDRYGRVPAIPIPGSCVSGPHPVDIIRTRALTHAHASHTALTFVPFCRHELERLRGVELVFTHGPSGIDERGRLLLSAREQPATWQKFLLVCH